MNGVACLSFLVWGMLMTIGHIDRLMGLNVEWELITTKDSGNR
jgi:hypothetical protein